MSSSARSRLNCADRPPRTHAVDATYISTHSFLLTKISNLLITLGMRCTILMTWIFITLIIFLPRKLMDANYTTRSSSVMMDSWATNLSFSLQLTPVSLCILGYCALLTHVVYRRLGDANVLLYVYVYLAFIYPLYMSPGQPHTAW
ncbi:hypothetical protein V8C35DRAFT_54549 [Trichoderma chlorosporum]